MGEWGFHGEPPSLPSLLCPPSPQGFRQASAMTASTHPPAPSVAPGEVGASKEGNGIPGKLSPHPPPERTLLAGEEVQGSTTRQTPACPEQGSALDTGLVATRVSEPWLPAATLPLGCQRRLRRRGSNPITPRSRRESRCREEALPDAPAWPSTLERGWGQPCSGSGPSRRWREVNPKAGAGGPQNGGCQ